MVRGKINRTNKALADWADILTEIDEVSAELEDSGWETLVLHPGDVATTDAAAAADAGFRLLVPDSELEALSSTVSAPDAAFDQFEVYRARDTNVRIFVVVVKSEETMEAVLYPVFYDPDTDRSFVETLRTEPEIRTTVSDLGDTRRCSFRHTEPALFLPE
ncbi:DUF7529 family protein [Haloferax gibbonsii]|uniref:Uncharacterized protein n=1 Tax=Haloferax gibbonsii TaxID=35746 RepID=A0A0K1ITD3_HALGI|nr:hypothetical protein [Haloferax gibbonsii]AKU07797.1 hypothetical protein ABY42_08575 [Haloferax gibbonsii]